MKKIIFLALLSIGMCTMLCAQNYFIKFEGIEGESLDKNHVKWSNVLSFKYSSELPSSSTSGQSRRRGSAQLEDLVIEKMLDKASVKIQQALATGKIYPKVTLNLMAGRDVVFYKYELTNVLVTSYEISGNDGDRPVETFSLNFEKIKVTYSELLSNGATRGEVVFEWNKKGGS